MVSKVIISRYAQQQLDDHILQDRGTLLLSFLPVSYQSPRKRTFHLSLPDKRTIPLPFVLDQVRGKGDEPQSYPPIPLYAGDESCSHLMEPESVSSLKYFRQGKRS